MIICDSRRSEDLVNRTSTLTVSDLEWKPLYPNNMPGNGQDGEFCLLLHQTEEGWSGRKYTIKYQYVEDEKGFTKKDKVELYILFEKTYSSIKGELSHPKPDDFSDFDFNNENTFSKYEVNSCGSFVRAFKDIDKAKERALIQYKAIYGYALAHII